MGAHLALFQSITPGILILEDAGSAPVIELVFFNFKGVKTAVRDKKESRKWFPSSLLEKLVGVFFSRRQLQAWGFRMTFFFSNSEAIVRNKRGFRKTETSPVITPLSRWFLRSQATANVHGSGHHQILTPKYCHSLIMDLSGYLSTDAPPNIMKIAVASFRKAGDGKEQERVKKSVYSVLIYSERIKHGDGHHRFPVVIIPWLLMSVSYRSSLG
ncbi:hypothetical protein BCR34DRAFT_652096 [Clohesyomyces aquaticus]|uniref:Uncharacterized protein n=1 Tax=Clohesyomyces aquaticus TaxID=1231657 RepID=A0A1Y1ZNK5_9PLEO|nr:hypothetical protein BCR34DRAFT_652096 [Clohesyomyces aquaticus]